MNYFISLLKTYIFYPLEQQDQLQFYGRIILAGLCSIIQFVFLFFYLPLSVNMKLYLYTFKIVFFPQPQLSMMVYRNAAQKRTYPHPSRSAPAAFNWMEKVKHSIFIKGMFVYNINYKYINWLVLISSC